MSFELFNYMNKTITPKISIRKDGNIGFSHRVVDDFNLRNNVFCELYFDEDRNCIGFKFTNNESVGITIRIIKRKIDVCIIAKRFLDYYDIDYQKTRAYLGQVSEEEGLIYIDLNKPFNRPISR